MSSFALYAVLSKNINVVYYIYVRSNSNTPKETKLLFKFPDQEVEYTCKNTLLSELSREYIIEKRLYPLIPYYIVRYEKEIKREDGDVSKALEDLKYLYDNVKGFVDKGEIDSVEANDLADYAKWLIQHIANGNSNQERMVEQMGGKILITPTQQLLIDNWNNGKAEGIAEGIEQGIEQGIKQGREESEARCKALEAENARLKAQLEAAGLAAV